MNACAVCQKLITDRESPNVVVCAACINNSLVYVLNRQVAELTAARDRLVTKNATLQALVQTAPLYDTHGHVCPAWEHRRRVALGLPT